MSYYLEPATIKDALILADGLTVADRQELDAGGHAPLEVILWGLENSLSPLAIFDKEARLAAIAGVVPQDSHYHVGAPWMLSTRFTKTEPLSFVKQARYWLDDQLSQYSLLRNHVWCGNHDHIRLLKLLGFTVKPSKDYESFLAFHQCAPH